jgi:hypothetical protein
MKKTLFILLASFFIISCGDGYITENGNVYYIIKPSNFAEHGGHGSKILLKNADPDSFEELEVGYGKDKKNVYLKGNLIKKADPETFEIIDFVNKNSYGDKDYSKDKNYVFFYGEQIQNANPKTFQIPVEKEEY